MCDGKYRRWCGKQRRGRASVPSDDATEWLRNLPRVVSYGSVKVVHASNTPVGNLAIHSGPEDAGNEFSVSVCCSICFNGHTHVPIIGVHRQGEAPESLEFSSTVSIQSGCKVLINPGSVGQPRDNDPRSNCAIFETRDRTLRYLRTEYDIAKTQRAMAAAGLPESFIERLAHGR